jgi:ribulose-phosphate 3-epimerase
MKYTASIACASQINIEKDINALINNNIDIMHLDVMDGHFVPNLSLNFDLFKEMHSLYPQLILDVHLMVTNPFNYILKCKESGVTYVTTHLKALEGKVSEFINQVHQHGMKVGLVLGLDESVEELRPYVHDIDLILVMAIRPGFYGQSFHEVVYERVEQLVKYREYNKFSYLISIDGGIDYPISKKLKQLKPDLLVMGVFTIFQQPKSLDEACKRYLKFMEEE